MKPHFPFKNLIPTFFAGLIDDPLLLLRTRPDGHHLMFDCGQIHHLAKRTFTHLNAIFISHAHMDHWMGIDAVVRQLIAADKTVDIFGGSGIADKFEHKLRGYDWNLAEDYWSDFRVHEIASGQVLSFLFAGRNNFERTSLESRELGREPLFWNRFVEVRTESCDHRVESLIYRIDERPMYRVDQEQLELLNLKAGQWLADLKRFYVDQKGWPDHMEIEVLDDSGEKVIIPNVEELAAKVIKPGRRHAIGYVSDVGFSRANRDRIVGLMKGVDLLCCECTFLSEAKERARKSSHLCTDDVNELLEEIRPAFFIPMHLSRSYSRRHRELYRQLDPPEGTTVLELPLQLTPRPLTADEVGWKVYSS